MAKIQKKIVKGIIYQFANLLVTGLVGILFVPFIIKNIGVVQYGIFEMVCSLNIINALLEIGVGSTIVNYAKKYYDENKEQFQYFFWTFFWIKFFISVLAFLLCIFLLIYSESIFTKINIENINEFKFSLFWFAVGIIFSNLNSFLDAIMNGFVRFDLTARSNIYSKIFYILIFFIWIYLLQSKSIVEFCFLTFVMVPISKFFIQVYQFIRFFPYLVSKPKFIKTSFLKETIKFLAGFSFITLFAQLYHYGLQVLLSILASPVFIAEFGIIRRIVLLVNNISGMVTRPIMPAATELKDKYSIEDIVLKGTKVHLILVTGLMFLFLINVEVISAIYLNSKFLDFNIHFFILSITPFIPSYGIMLMLYYNEGKTQRNVKNNLSLALSSLIGAFLGFQFFDFLGFIIGLTLASGTISIIQVFWYLKYFRINKWNFFKNYVKQYIILAICYIIFFIIYSLIGFNFVSIILWNILILSILFISSWKDIGKRLIHSF